MTTHTNNTWPDEVDDLTWLARNAKPGHFDDERSQSRIKKSPGGWNCSTHITDGYTRDQWLQRRRELGLEDDDGVAAALDEKAAEMAEAEPAEWVPEVGKECYLTIGGEKHHVEIEGYSRKKDVVFVKYHGLHEFDYWFLGDDARFRPIETPEQKAERELTEYLAAHTPMDSKHCRVAAEAFVQWLKSEGKV